MCLIYIAEMQVVEPPLATTIAHRVIPAHCSDSGWWVVVEVGSGWRGSSSGGIGCWYKLRSPAYERQWPRECVLGPFTGPGWGSEVSVPFASGEAASGHCWRQWLHKPGGLLLPVTVKNWEKFLNDLTSGEHRGQNRMVEHRAASTSVPICLQK